MRTTWASPRRPTRLLPGAEAQLLPIRLVPVACILGPLVQTARPEGTRPELAIAEREHANEDQTPGSSSLVAPREAYLHRSKDPST